MIQQIEVTIETPHNPTEVSDRLVRAITTIFPTADVEVREDAVVGTAHSLSRLSELLHRREILDTARSEFFRDLRPNGFSFTIKKQPATEGVVTFAVGEPGELGEIDVDVRVIEPTPEAVIDDVAPPTEDGRPIEPSRGKSPGE